MNEIIGREKEKGTLKKILTSKEAAFIAVYGRRRIGKTFLIRNFFKDKGLFFHLTGIQDASLDMQLGNFAIEFSDHFCKGKEVKRPSDWMTAFQMLRKEIEKVPKENKVVMFFDELPWLATPRSMLLQALDHLWNRYLSNMPNVILVVCGSSASWMIDHVVHHKGGLHGRITQEIRLLPFNLKETEQFLQAKEIRLDRKQILEVYMCLGGVAKYLSYLERGKSAAQMIGELCFTYNAPLIAEFHKLYKSLFQHHECHLEIIRVLAKKRFGFTYKELVDQTTLSSGGSLTSRLEELKQSGFILEVPQFGKGVKNNRFLLIDEYSLFFLTWCQGVSALDLQTRGADFWLKQRNSQEWKSWTGFSYEVICLKHIENLKGKLGLSAVNTSTSRWRYIPEKDSPKKGAEIDLVIDRKDQCINLCEIKFYDDLFSLDQSGSEKLKYKRSCFERETGTKKATFSTLITTYGAKHNEHYLSSIDQELTMDDLF
jgi:hypothetical protein